MRTRKEIQEEIERRFPTYDKWGKPIIYAHHGLSCLVDELNQAKLREALNKTK